MKIIPSTFIAFAIVLLFAGCKKTTTSSLLTGNIYGYVTLYDQYGAKILTGQSGTTVTSGTTAVTTDSAGKYVFSNMKEGEYNFSFSRPGFGSINSNYFQFVGGGDLDHDVKLSAIPAFYDSVLAISDTAGYLVLSGTLSGTDTRRRTVAVFIGATSGASSDPANYLITYNTLTNSNPNSINNFTLKIPNSDLTDAGFVSGATVYVAVYGAAAEFASSSASEDLAHTGRLYYTALNPQITTGQIQLP
jgi:hypothetical protein